MLLSPLSCRCYLRNRRESSSLGSVTRVECSVSQIVRRRQDPRGRRVVMFPPPPPPGARGSVRVVAPGSEGVQGLPVRHPVVPFFAAHTVYRICVRERESPEKGGPLRASHHYSPNTNNDACEMSRLSLFCALIVTLVPQRGAHFGALGFWAGRQKNWKDSFCNLWEMQEVFLSPPSRSGWSLDSVGSAQKSCTA